MSDTGRGEPENDGSKLNPIRVAAEELRAAAEDMEEAAWREGIRPSGPLGVWVQAARCTLVKLADIIEHQSDAVTDTVANAKVLAEAEVAKLREARLAAEIALKQAETSLRTLEIKKATLTSEMVQVIAPGLRDELKQAVVIKERRHNRNVEWGRALATGALVLGLVAGGYALGVWDDSGVNAAVSRCELHPVPDGQGGRYCRLDELLAR